MSPCASLVISATDLFINEDFATSLKDVKIVLDCESKSFELPFNLESCKIRTHEGKAEYAVDYSVTFPLPSYHLVSPLLASVTCTTTIGEVTEYKTSIEAWIINDENEREWITRLHFNERSVQLVIYVKKTVNQPPEQTGPPPVNNEVYEMEQSDKQVLNGGHTKNSVAPERQRVDANSHGNGSLQQQVLQHLQMVQKNLEATRSPDDFDSEIAAVTHTQHSLTSTHTQHSQKPNVPSTHHQTSVPNTHHGVQNTHPSVPNRHPSVPNRHPSLPTHHQLSQSSKDKVKSTDPGSQVQMVVGPKTGVQRTISESGSNKHATTEAETMRSRILNWQAGQSTSSNVGPSPNQVTSSPGTADMSMAGVVDHMSMSQVNIPSVNASVTSLGNPSMGVEPNSESGPRSVMVGGQPMILNGTFGPANIVANPQANMAQPLVNTPVIYASDAALTAHQMVINGQLVTGHIVNGQLVNAQYINGQLVPVSPVTQVAVSGQVGIPYGRQVKADSRVIELAGTAIQGGADHVSHNCVHVKTMECPGDVKPQFYAVTAMSLSNINALPALKQQLADGKLADLTLSYVCGPSRHKTIIALSSKEALNSTLDISFNNIFLMDFSKESSMLIDLLYGEVPIGLAEFQFVNLEEVNHPGLRSFYGTISFLEDEPKGPSLLIQFVEMGSHNINAAALAELVQGCIEHRTMSPDRTQKMSNVYEMMGNVSCNPAPFMGRRSGRRDSGDSMELEALHDGNIRDSGEREAAYRDVSYREHENRFKDGKDRDGNHHGVNSIAVSSHGSKPGERVRKEGGRIVPKLSFDQIYGAPTKSESVSVRKNSDVSINFKHQDSKDLSTKQARDTWTSRKHMKVSPEYLSEGGPVLLPEPGKRLVGPFGYVSFKIDVLEGLKHSAPVIIKGAIGPEYKCTSRVLNPSDNRYKISECIIPVNTQFVFPWYGDRFLRLSIIDKSKNRVTAASVVDLETFLQKRRQVYTGKLDVYTWHSKNPNLWEAEVKGNMHVRLKLCTSRP